MSLEPSYRSFRFRFSSLALILASAFSSFLRSTRLAYKIKRRCGGRGVSKEPAIPEEELEERRCTLAFPWCSRSTWPFSPIAAASA